MDFKNYKFSNLIEDFKCLLKHYLQLQEDISMLKSKLYMVEQRIEYLEMVDISLKPTEDKKIQCDLNLPYKYAEQYDTPRHFKLDPYTLGFTVK